MPPPVRSPERSSAVSAKPARPPGMPAHTASAAKRAFSATWAPGQRQGHGVAPAGVEVGRDLQRGRRRLAPHRRDAHPVGTLLRQLNAVEARHGVGAEVARAADLVEQLRRHRPDRDHAARPGVLGDHRRAVRVQLGQGEADALPARHLLEEGVVPAAALGAALNDVPRHHRAGDGVEVAVGPAERVQRRPDDQGGIGDPARSPPPARRRPARRRSAGPAGRRSPSPRAHRPEAPRRCRG